MSDNLISNVTPRNDELDGVLLLHAALRYGLEVEVYPRQVVVASASPATELSFVHGVPGTSGLGPVTYAQDKRMRRALMERAGIPVPKGATFTIGRGIPGAKNFAAQLGFPVTIAPAIGDNGIEAFRNLNSREDMDVALEYLRTPPTERTGFTRAAYGLTELREPGEANGRIVVPPGYMFLLEKQLVGEYIHVLVVNGQVRSAIRCDGVPSDNSLNGGEEIVDRVHPQLAVLAQRAANVIPGLAVVSLGIVVSDPFAALDEQTFGIVDYSERPGLWVQAAVDHGLASRLAEEILTSYSVAMGAKLAVPVEDVRVTFEAHALPDVARGAEALEYAAHSAGLAIETTRRDETAGMVMTNLAGSAATVARLVNALLAGEIGSQRAMLGVLTPSSR